MDSVNILQVVASFRMLLASLGAVAAVFGLATKEQIAALTDAGLWTGIGGAIVAALAIGSAVRSRSTKNMVAATATLPDVKAVIATPAVADSSVTPANVVTTSAAAGNLPGVL